VEIGDEMVETTHEGGAWTVRVGATLIGSYVARSAAIDAGTRLSSTFGIHHVVRYATAHPVLLAAS
jgi:hypothetical protein